MTTQLEDSPPRTETAAPPGKIRIALTVNGTARQLEVAPWTTLLDALREHLRLTGTKKGCDHGQCGACTVLLDGRRTLSCLSLAVAHDGSEVTTADGLGVDGALHPLQEAFLAHDAYQCGYCTPGQICSAVGMLAEAAAGAPSIVTGDLAAPVDLDRAEIAERLSGNLCRCGAYAHIVDAVSEVAR